MSAHRFDPKYPLLNLILLLSALLSAISGGADVRAGQAPTALSRSVVQAAVKATEAARLQVAARPVQALPTLAQLPAIPVRAFALTAAIPAFADKLRE